MKKLFLAAVMMMGFAGISFAQTAKPATDKATSKKEAKKPVIATTAKPAPASPSTAAAKPVSKTAPATAAKPTPVVLKKDGTADKRYKNTAKATGPTKKDGTPDKRFKENKKP